MGRIRAVVMDKTGTITEGNFVLQQVMPLGSLAEEELLALDEALKSVKKAVSGVL